MTRKRFQKLSRSEMTKLMAHTDGAANCIRAAARITVRNFGNCNSYLECWEVLRNAFTYPGNIPPVK